MALPDVPIWAQGRQPAGEPGKAEAELRGALAPFGGDQHEVLC